VMAHYRLHKHTHRRTIARGSIIVHLDGGSNGYGWGPANHPRGLNLSTLTLTTHRPATKSPEWCDNATHNAKSTCNNKSKSQY